MFGETQQVLVDRQGQVRVDPLVRGLLKGNIDQQHAARPDLDIGEHGEDHPSGAFQTGQHDGQAFDRLADGKIGSLKAAIGEIASAPFFFCARRSLRFIRKSLQRPCEMAVCRGRMARGNYASVKLI